MCQIHPLELDTGEEMSPQAPSHDSWGFRIPSFDRVLELDDLPSVIVLTEKVTFLSLVQITELSFSGSPVANRASKSAISAAGTSNTSAEKNSISLTNRWPPAAMTRNATTV